MADDDKGDETGARKLPSIVDIEPRVVRRGDTVTIIGKDLLRGWPARPVAMLTARHF
jgi:hypothetical protein